MRSIWRNLLRRFGLIVCIVVCGVVAFLVFVWLRKPVPGQVKDEALLAGRDASSFPAADEDYFHDMDGAIPLSSDEVKGRNMWVVWTGGDDKMWDTLTVTSIGTLDLLKTISSFPGMAAARANRWKYLGLVNEPCFNKATGPDPQRYGLWVDSRVRTARPTRSKTKRNILALKSARAENLPTAPIMGTEGESGFDCSQIRR